MLFKIFLGESDFITLKQKETRNRFLYIIQTVNLNHCLLLLLSILLEFSEFVNTLSQISSSLMHAHISVYGMLYLEDHNVVPSPVGLGKQTKYNVIL